MQRNIYVREIYFYLVCVITLIIFIIGLVTIYDNLINYIKPTIYLTEPAMISMYREQYPELPFSQIEKMAIEEVEISLRFEKDIAIKGLLRGIFLLAISIPIFTFHWKKARGLRNNEN